MESDYDATRSFCLSRRCFIKFHQFQVSREEIFQLRYRGWKSHVSIHRTWIFQVILGWIPIILSHHFLLCLEMKKSFYWCRCFLEKPSMHFNYFAHYSRFFFNNISQKMIPLDLFKSPRGESLLIPLIQPWRGSRNPGAMHPFENQRPKRKPLRRRVTSCKLRRSKMLRWNRLLAGFFFLPRKEMDKVYTPSIFPWNLRYVARRQTCMGTRTVGWFKLYMRTKKGQGIEKRRRLFSYVPNNMDRSILCAQTKIPSKNLPKKGRQTGSGLELIFLIHPQRCHTFWVDGVVTPLSSTPSISEREHIFAPF